MNTRRALLKTLTLAPLVLAVAPRLQAAAAPLTRVDLGKGLSLIQGAGTNVVVAQSADGVVIVDGGSPERANELLAEIRKLTNNKPIKALFNTNWRPERCGLNALLGPSGVPIIAHENSRLYQNADFYVDWQDKQYKPQPKAAQANKTFYQTGTLAFGEETIDYGFISQANTDGDIYVRFPKADVLVVGDMLVPGGYLLLDYTTGGWIGGAQKTTDGLLAKCGAATKVVAGSGGVVGKAAVQEQVAVLKVAYDAVSKAIQGGRGLEELKQADPMKDYKARYGSPDVFLALLYRSTGYHVPGRAVRNVV